MIGVEELRSAFGEFEVREYLSSVKQLVAPDEHQYRVLETTRICNRHCPYCGVWKQSQARKPKEFAIAGIERAIDRLHDAWGYRYITILGGEPLLDWDNDRFKTAEGITPFDQTLQAVEHASSKNMVVGVSTNADCLTRDKGKEMKDHGLTWLTLSLHDYTKEAVEDLVRKAQMAASIGLVPIIHAVVTRKTADFIPGIAAFAASNGILFNATIVQINGGCFSAKQPKEVIPTWEQQVKIFDALALLKVFGLSGNSRRLLLESLKYYGNTWKCSPEKDSFIHVGAEGTLDVCEEIRSPYTIFEIEDLKDKRWRDFKKKAIEDCSGCLYRCYFTSQTHPGLRDLPTGVLMCLIKGGKGGLAAKWGQVADKAVRVMKPEINWDLNPN